MKAWGEEVARRQDGRHARHVYSAGEHRFVVCETSGHPIGQTSHPRNHAEAALLTHMSAVVLDRVYCYQLMAEFRTEDAPGWLAENYNPSLPVRRAWVRAKARLAAAELEWRYNRV